LASRQLPAFSNPSIHALLKNNKPKQKETKMTRSHLLIGKTKWDIKSVYWWPFICGAILATLENQGGGSYIKLRKVQDLLAKEWHIFISLNELVTMIKDHGDKPPVGIRFPRKFTITVGNFSALQVFALCTHLLPHH
jgi:hypothetical protein